MTLLTNNQEIADPKAVADVFNQYCANVSKNLSENIPLVTNSSLDYLANSSVDLVSSLFFSHKKKLKMRFET